jgi:histidyl-tRNA synthetase
MKISAIRGFADIFPGEVDLWQYVEQRTRTVFATYNFAEIRIPILEKTELFTRTLGETTDVVEKEMYTFADHDAQGSSLTLRPEGTAGVVRAYVESEIYKTEPVQKLYYIGPMFRRERPQKGRMRQFHQIGAEVLGRGDPFIDAEILLMLNDFFSAVGLTALALQLNSLGCAECRPGYRQALLRFLKEREELLCGNCRRRLERNPLRVLDCKEPGCSEATRHAPSTIDFLCAACKDHFENVQRLLRQSAIDYSLNPRLVRGLDYYYRTTFEWTTDRLGAQSAVAAGGRYDGLVAELGGPSLPGVGFAIGVERLTMLLGLRETRERLAPELYVVWVGEEARQWAVGPVHQLRQNGVVVEMDGESRSVKSQMRRADKLRAKSVLIVGENELNKGRVILRNMASKEQVEVSMEKLTDELLLRKAN